MYLDRLLKAGLPHGACAGFFIPTQWGAVSGLWGMKIHLSRSPAGEKAGGPDRKGPEDNTWIFLF